MTDDTQPEALRIADEFRECLERDAIPSIIDVEKAVAELCRQHARIAELEAQLESIGAGGVSGPLMGQPQAMPDLSALTERGAQAWAGVDAQGLRDGVVSAGSEPVAWRYVPSKVWGDKVFTDDPVRAEDARQAGCVVEPLYDHPSPPEGMVAEQALRKVLSVVQRYLPPDGPTAHDAMTEIIEIVDPWPLGPLERP